MRIWIAAQDHISIDNPFFMFTLLDMFFKLYVHKKMEEQSDYWHRLLYPFLHFYLGIYSIFSYCSILYAIEMH
jgi:hypothetical protein